MPVVDFHLHAYDFPIKAPADFVEFMDKQLGSSFATFAERYSDPITALGTDGGENG